MRNTLNIITGVLLIVALFTAGYLYVNDLKKKDVAHTDEVHVHSDFLLYINGEKADLSADRYQSSSERTLHEDMHLHDNNDKVLHRHAEGITLVNFFDSLGIKLNDTCIIINDNEQYCTDNENKLEVLVNGVNIEDITNYINQEEDRILVFYGNKNEADMLQLQNEITSDACIYSGTCPQKGLPPPESCGLTCDV